MSKKFSLDINLDDEEEVREFYEKYKSFSPSQLSIEFQFGVSVAAQLAAQSLLDYSWHKKAAIHYRLEGKIRDAINHEKDCDRIYREEIQPNIKWW